MDPIELNELWRAAKKLWRLVISSGSVLNQLIGLPSKQQEPKVYASELPTVGLAEGFRMAENLVQSLLLLADT